MNSALWVVQILLAALFITIGAAKALAYETARAKMPWPWVKELDKNTVRFIGFSELAGGIGLLLPSLAGVLPILTPLAALGLLLVMVMGGVFHVWRREWDGIWVNIVLGALAAFVAWGRF